MQRIRFLFFITLFFGIGNLAAANKYDPELLTRQLLYYSLYKADQSIKEGDYKTAAKHIISCYPVDSKYAVSLAVSMDGKVNKPLEQFLFEAFQEIVNSDPSICIEKNGQIVVDGNWIDQKSKWTDELMPEIAAYKKVKEYLKNDAAFADRFFFGAYHTYYMLDNEEALRFLEGFDSNSVTYKILESFAETVVLRNRPDIKTLNKIAVDKLSRPLKEMVVTLKGDYYMNKNDYKKAKKNYLEFFEQGYSLPAHVENLAMCYLNEGDRSQAKSLYLSLINLIQMENITPAGVYNLACIFALEGDKTRAINFLTAAFARGVPKSWAKDDKDLKSLRGDERFIELMKGKKPKQ